MSTLSFDTFIGYVDQSVTSKDRDKLHQLRNILRSHNPADLSDDDEVWRKIAFDRYGTKLKAVATSIRDTGVTDLLKPLATSATPSSALPSASASAPQSPELVTQLCTFMQSMMDQQARQTQAMMEQQAKQSQAMMERQDRQTQAIMDQQAAMMDKQTEALSLLANKFSSAENQSSTHISESKPELSPKYAAHEKRLWAPLLEERFPTFDGEDPLKFKLWMNDLKARIKLTEVPDEFAIIHVRKCLSGRALRQFERLPDEDRETFEQVCEFLESQYGDHFAAQNAMNKLLNLRQRPKDHVRDFGLFVDSLVRQALPDTQPAALKIQLKHYFMTGLHNQSLQNTLYTLPTFEMMSFKELIDNAERIEFAEKRAKTSGKPMDSFCIFHNSRGHSTNECTTALAMAKNSATSGPRNQRSAPSMGRTINRQQNSRGRYPPTPRNPPTRQFQPNADRYPARRNSDKWCLFHNSVTHNTEDCVSQRQFNGNRPFNATRPPMKTEWQPSKVNHVQYGAENETERERVINRIQHAYKETILKNNGCNRVSRPAAYLNGVPFSTCRPDNGADLSIVTSKVVKKLGLLPKPTNEKPHAANGSALSSDGCVDIQIEYAGGKTTHRCFVSDEINYDILLGEDLLPKLGIRMTTADGSNLLPEADDVDLSPEICRKLIQHCKLQADDESALVIFADKAGQLIKAAHVPLHDQKPVTEAVINEIQKLSKDDWAKMLNIGTCSEADHQKVVNELFTLRHAFSSDYKAGTCQNVDEIGCTEVEHEIDTGDTRPFKVPPRRIPLKLRPEVEKMLKDLLDQGCIIPSNSNYSSAFVLAKKKDGSWRFCVDFRQLNLNTRRDSYPLPRMDDMLDLWPGRKFFTTLDIKCGYYNIRIKKEDQHKTAFTALDQLFEWKRMPFGLHNAPATFQRAMNNILMDHKAYCRAYLDDIIIASTTLDEHIEHLKAVISTVCKAGMRLNPRKCHFLKQKIQYLGHVISADGISIDPDKAAAIRDYPLPITKKDGASFLGLASYMRRFHHNLSHRLAPLWKLFQAAETNGTKLQWSEELKQLFHKICQEMGDPRSLAMPVPGRDYVITTDASADGLGAMLEQANDNGQLHPIAFASRVTAPAEKRYSATELEARGVIYALETFRPYITGEKVTVFTDHNPLTHLFQKNSPSHRLYRWCLVLQQFDVTLCYKPGIKNQVADALSRAPTGSIPVRMVGGKTIDEPETSLNTVCNIRLSHMLAKLTKPAAVNNIVLADKTERDEMLQCHHEGRWAAHASAQKTYQRLRPFYSHETWPTLAADVQAYCKQCNICKQRSTRYEVLPLLPRPPPDQPRRRWHMDYSTFMPNTYKGPRFCLVAIDAMSRFIEAKACTATDAKNAVKLFNEIISTHGVPEEVVTDSGTHFNCQEFQSMLQKQQTKLHTTTPGSKTSNGICERAIRTLQDILAKKQANDGRAWNHILPDAVAAYNATEHSATGATPFEVHYGSKRATTGHEFEPAPPLIDFWKRVNERVKSAQQKAATAAFSTNPNTRFNIGDSVFVRDAPAMGSRKAKLDLPNSREGEIESFPSPKAAVIEFTNGKHRTVPINMLQPRFVNN